MAKITIDGKELFNNRVQVALMPQRGKLNWNFPITVEGLVSLGRVNHSKLSCCEIVFSQGQTQKLCVGRLRLDRFAVTSKAVSCVLDNNPWRTKRVHGSPQNVS